MICALNKIRRSARHSYQQQPDFSPHVKPCTKTFTCTGTQSRNRHFHWLHLKLRNKSHSFNITESQKLKISETKIANYFLAEIKSALCAVVLFDFSASLKLVPPFLDESCLFAHSFFHIYRYAHILYIFNKYYIKMFQFLFLPLLDLYQGKQ